jgi:hypothetical protein
MSWQHGPRQIVRNGSPLVILPVKETPRNVLVPSFLKCPFDVAKQITVDRRFNHGCAVTDDERARSRFVFLP